MDAERAVRACAKLLRTPAGEAGRAYLARRGIGEAAVAAFELGYCPPGKLPPGVAGAPPGSPWARMGGRVVIPVRDDRGRLVAVSGRAVDPEVMPKYIHTAFPTARYLFGLWVNRRAILRRGWMLITEGQLDVVTAWQAGLDCVASAFGAHLSTWQIALAARYAARVGLAFDADAAGERGAKAAVDELGRIGAVNGAVGVRVRPMRLMAAGDDLDTWLRREGAPAVRAVERWMSLSAEDVLRERLAVLDDPPAPRSLV